MVISTRLIKCLQTAISFALSITRASQVAQMVKHLPAMWETWVQSLGWDDSLEKEMATHSSTLAGKSHGQRSLVGYSPRGHKELDMTERLHFSLIQSVQNRKICREKKWISLCLGLRTKAGRASDC